MEKIHTVLETIRKLVNEYIQNIDRRGDDWVVLTSSVYHDGSVNEAIRDRIVMNLYNITPQNIISSHAPVKGKGGVFAVTNPPLYIDLHLMFMANLPGDNYPDALSAISRIISFFQQNPSFNQSNAHDLGPEIDNITLEMSSLDPVEINCVMGMLGTKYMPSVFYKLRMLTFAS